jgi:hypothetical protein
MAHSNTPCSGANSHDVNEKQVFRVTTVTLKMSIDSVLLIQASNTSHLRQNVRR